MQARRLKDLTGRFGIAMAFTLVLAVPCAAFAQTTTQPPASDVVTGSTATPAETTVAAPAPSAPSSTPRWTGVYVGVLFGQARNTSAATTTTVFSPTGYFASSSVPAIATAGAQTLDAKQATGGFEGGFNVEGGPIVFGVEFDWDRMKFNTSQASTATYPCCAPTAFTVTQSITTTYLTTLRGRLGVAAGPVLIYGTGGVAWTNPDYETVFTDTFATAHENGGVSGKVHTGIWGGGLEVQANHHVSFKGEFLRAEFDPLTTTSSNLTAFTPAIAFPSNVFTHSTTFILKTFRFGVNIGF